MKAIETAVVADRYEAADDDDSGLSPMTAPVRVG
jgi:hypothetical protein